MKYFFKIFVIVGLCVTTNNADNLESETIIGGNLANDGQIKYQVSVQRNNTHVCGGAIVSEKHAVTAAHCMVNIKLGRYYEGKYTALVNAFNTFVPGESALKYLITTVYTPKAFASYQIIDNKSYILEGDLAVIKLRKGLKLSSANTDLSKVTVSAHINYLKEILISSGHGVSSLKMQRDPVTKKIIELGLMDGNLRYASVMIVNNKRCSAIQKNFNPTFNVCGAMVQRPAKEPEGHCSRDSGSPLVYNGTILVGIFISNSIGCAENVQPAIFTRVSFYRTFVKNAVKGMRTNDMVVAKWKKVSIFKSKYQFQIE